MVAENVGMLREGWSGRQEQQDRCQSGVVCWICAAAIFRGGRSVRLKAKAMENVAHLSGQELQGPDCCCLAVFWKEFWGQRGFWWVLGSFRGHGAVSWQSRGESPQVEHL